MYDEQNEDGIQFPELITPPLVFLSEKDDPPAIQATVTVVSGSEPPPLPKQNKIVGNLISWAVNKIGGIPIH